MLLRVPEYYDHFHCIASACPDNCCIGWEIDIDPASDLRYRQTEGAFGEHLRASIRRDGATPCFHLSGERCVLLNKENLCELILHLGEDSLCQICRDHPRFTDTFGTLRETGVGLCCPEATRLLLSEREPLRFATREIPEVGDEGECDTEQLRRLMEAREELFHIVQNRAKPLTERMCLALGFAERLQGTPVQETASPGEAVQTIGEWLTALSELEAINKVWMETLNRTRSVLNRPEKELLSLWHQFSAAAEEWAQEYEHLLMYFLVRYVLKAVYTGDGLTPVQLAVVNCLLIGTLELAQFAQQGSLLPEERIALAGLYSKQMEYSEENLEALEDRLIFDRSFSCEQIRTILRWMEK